MACLFGDGIGTEAIIVGSTHQRLDNRLPYGFGLGGQFQTLYPFHCLLGGCKQGTTLKYLSDVVTAFQIARSFEPGNSCLDFGIRIAVIGSEAGFYLWLVDELCTGGDQWRVVILLASFAGPESYSAQDLFDIAQADFTHGLELELFLDILFIKQQYAVGLCCIAASSSRFL